MYGFGYSLKQHFAFSNTEIRQIFWTSLAFGFILSFRKWGSGKEVDLLAGVGNWLLALLFVAMAMIAHVSLQKIVAIKLGYTATYSYWLNGILLSVLLAFMSMGVIWFILPGSVMIAHTPGIRLGKFRYGLNLKDIARVALAGTIAHILLVMVIGIFYFAFGRSELLQAFILVNLLLAVYSLLPIPKIDIPTKMDAGSDGLGMFFFSRTLYVLVLATVVCFAILSFLATTYAGLWWLFIISFILGCIIAGSYAAALEQSN